MNVFDCLNQEIGAKIERDNEHFFLRDSMNDEFQLVICKHNDFLYSNITVKSIIKFEFHTNRNFVIHHSGVGDILSVQKRGRIEFIEEKFVSRILIDILTDGQIRLEVTFCCYSEEFWFGLGTPKGKYIGNREIHLQFLEFNVSTSKMEIASVEPAGKTFAQLYAPDKTVLPRSLHNEKTRLIIPIHSPKIPYLLHFLRTLDAAATKSGTGVCDVILILNQGADYALYRSICSNHKFSFIIDCLFVENFLEERKLDLAHAHLMGGAARGVAVFKKLVALYALSLNDSDEKYNICIDADSECLRWDSNFGRKVAANYNRKTFFGVPAINDVTHRINLSAYQLLATAHEEESKDNLEIYTWFFDVTTYSSQDLREFFKYVADTHGSLDQFFAKLSWFTFEHKIFMYYLKNRGAKIIDYSEGNKELVRIIPESLTASQLLFIAWKYDYSPLWLRAGAVERASTLANELLNPYFLYHTDRS